MVISKTPRYADGIVNLAIIRTKQYGVYITKQLIPCVSLGAFRIQIFNYIDHAVAIEESYLGEDSL